MKLPKYAGLDNRDLRLRNIKEQDLLFYRHKIFIVAYQKAKSVAEVARKFRLSIKAVTHKASVLRRRGIALKKFTEALELTPQRRASLARLAREFAPRENLQDHEKFVRLWQSRPVSEVAKAFGIPREHASFRAARLRNVFKIPLRLQKAVHVNRATLQRIARETWNAPHTHPPHKLRASGRT